MSHALCPGSFDPPTVGHLDIITRASVLFDKVTVGVIRNTTKTAILNAPERVEMLKLCVEKLSNVEVISFVRDLARYGGDISPLVPSEIYEQVRARFANV